MSDIFIDLLAGLKCNYEEKIHCFEFIKRCVALSEKSRREGLLSLDDDIEGLEHELLRHGIDLICNGKDPVMVRHYLDVSLATGPKEGRECLEDLLAWQTTLYIQSGENPIMVQKLLLAILGKGFEELYRSWEEHDGLPPGAYLLMREELELRFRDFVGRIPDRVTRGDEIAIWDEEQHGYRLIREPSKYMLHNIVIRKAYRPGLRVEIVDQACLAAASDGQIAVIDERIHVMPILHVRRDVSRYCGNIASTGSVVVYGSVLPGFVVKAAGNIIVFGRCDDAILDAGGYVANMHDIAADH